MVSLIEWIWWIRRESPALQHRAHSDQAEERTSKRLTLTCFSDWPPKRSPNEPKFCRSKHTRCIGASLAERKERSACSLLQAHHSVYLRTSTLAHELAVCSHFRSISFSFVQLFTLSRILCSFFFGNSRIQVFPRIEPNLQSLPCAFWTKLLIFLANSSSWI